MKKQHTGKCFFCKKVKWLVAYIQAIGYTCRQCIITLNFDNRESKRHKIEGNLPNCDQCVAAMINGVFCHESGCPNMCKVWDGKRKRWIEQ